MQLNEKLYDQALEAQCLASLIWHPDYLRVQNVLRPKVFYDPTNQCIFYAIQTLIDKGCEYIDALDIETIISTSDPKIRRQIERDGLSDFNEYVDAAQYSARDTYEEYSVVEEQLVTLAFKREFRDQAKRLAGECENPMMDLAKLNDFCNDGFSKIVSRYMYGGDSCEIGEKLSSIRAEIEAQRTSSGYGIPFFLPRLNEFISIVKGEMTLVQGATGKGKSSFFLGQALYCALNLGIGVLIIDSELKDSVWTPRAIASISGVPVRKVKNGRFEGNEAEAVDRAYEILGSAPIVHQYMPEFDRIRIEQICRRWVNKGYGLIIYDYIKPTKNYHQAAEISQDMGLQADFMKNNIAGSLDIAVIAGLQQNIETGRAANSQKPEQYADSMVYWEEKDAERIEADGRECGNFMIRVGKNRNGSSTDESNYIDIMFSGDLMRIVEAKHHAERTPFR